MWKGRSERRVLVGVSLALVLTFALVGCQSGQSSTDGIWAGLSGASSTNELATIIADVRSVDASSDGSYAKLELEIQRARLIDFNADKMVQPGRIVTPKWSDPSETDLVDASIRGTIYHDSNRELWIKEVTVMDQ